ncbi:MAG: hypothetical protein A2919_00715 [Candidatus Spechtbacteria bacterium RIFCSPLOWO2_01_FULL_43_12]|uniref:EamA domain-containing protein n=1 Tax=Candidatus Spechtbacteria bacterium RIFCSPLOWO2_01_FULL_43_12 TaxID=1802162 RepID=A0A1G2HEU1_9BACT|nr:MAG: hypothetical protein A2919_00715 [Candidatus Spechtbacteria bacterium RIFCSPLOWO2_01_FULL_43_12]
MLWLYITLASYLFFALASIADRILLAGPLQHPRAYAFYTSITGVVAIFFIPFGFDIPSNKIILLSFLAGAAGVASLYFLYLAIFEGHISTAAPSVGALIPIFTLVLSYFLAGERIYITINGILALALLVVGTLMLSLHFKKKMPLFLSRRNMYLAASAAFLFALSTVLSKLIFIDTGFINGFIWMRMGGVILAFLLLLSRQTRRIVFKSNPIKEKAVLITFSWGKGAGGAAFLLQSYAINLASFLQVTFINALAGVQYAFILIAALAISFKHPKILKEEFTKASILERSLGILLITVGLWLLIK